MSGKRHVKVVQHRPSFDGVAVLKRAVAKQMRRKRALGQYAIVAHNGVVQKIDFSLKAS